MKSPQNICVIVVICWSVSIRKEFWNYSNLNTFVNTNAKILHIVEQNLEYAEASFGINIPSSELAYIAEIFL